MKKIILLCLLVIGLLLVGCGTEVPSEGDLETPPIIEDQLTEDQQADLVMAGASEESGAIAGQAVTQSYYNCKEEGDNVIYDASWKQGMKSPKVSCNAAKNKVYLRSCAEGGFLDITLIYNCDCSNVDACLSGTAPTVNTCTLTTGGVSLSYSDGSTEEKVNFCLRGKVQEFSCDESASLKFKVQSTFCGSGNVCSAGVCTEPNVVTVSLLSAQMLELNAGDFPLWGGYILVDEQKISNICPSTWCDKNTPFTVSLPQELSEGEHEVEVWTKYQGWGFTSFEVEVLGAPECYTDEECGGNVSENFCNAQGQACSNVVINQCNNPGTAEAECVSPAEGSGCGDCPYGCEDSACLEEQLFCYYLDSEGVQKPAGWKFYDFSWPYDYQGVVTNSGTFKKTCTDDNTSVIKPRCGENKYGSQADYLSGEGIEIGYNYSPSCGPAGCNPDTNDCCVALAPTTVYCEGNFLHNTTNTDCGLHESLPQDCDLSPSWNYTCYEYTNVIASCALCGRPICEKDGKYVTGSFSSSGEPVCFGGWTDTGEVVDSEFC
jgi:hypothetical protein